ncbi:MAG TPA: cation:proton antiporter, partial [Roseimicrobium sp.]|nr:cation:proton antiporter [Roseimicrobium sp.]
GLVTIVFHRLKLPVVLGYIIAGVIIGPYTPPYKLIAEEETIKTLGELGVILLMFGLGLEFSLKKLKAVGATAFIAATLEILLMIWVGYEIGRAFGWSPMDRLFLGAILSVSSTTIIVKALGEMGKTKERFAELIFGILIVEDILAILMIALLSGFATTGSMSWGEVGITMSKLGIFLTSTLVIGFIAVPRLIRYVAKFKSNEMLLVTVLGLCFGVSLIAIKLHYSVALGAFLIGAIIAECREIHKIEELMEPVRNMFSAVFFVAIGLLIDPRVLVDYAVPVIVITIAVVVGKVITCSLGTFVAGNDTRTSLRVGMGLAQIGEFSFIIASLGISLNVTSKFLYPIAVTVSAITTLLTPFLIKSTDGLVGWFDRVAPPKVVQYLGLYSSWVENLGRTKEASGARKLIRKMAGQLFINAALIAGAFIATAFLGQGELEWLPVVPAELGGRGALLWFGTVLLTLPLFIATSRKLQALGMLISELSIPRNAAGERTKALRAMIANTILTAGLFGLGLLTVVLSATLLPPTNVLLVLLVLIGVVVWFMGSSMIKVYSQAQIALSETLNATPPEPHVAYDTRIPGILKAAKLKSVTLPAGSPAIGKLIREIALRTRCGASIVGIERNGENIINPDPNEELHAGDILLLIGSDAQIHAGERILQETSE